MAIPFKSGIIVNNISDTTGFLKLATVAGGEVYLSVPETVNASSESSLSLTPSRAMLQVGGTYVQVSDHPLTQASSIRLKTRYIDNDDSTLNTTGGITIEGEIGYWSNTLITLTGAVKLSPYSVNGYLYVDEEDGLITGKMPMTWHLYQCYGNSSTSINIEIFHTGTILNYYTMQTLLYSRGYNEEMIYPATGYDSRSNLKVIGCYPGDEGLYVVYSDNTSQVISPSMTITAMT